MSEPLFQAVNIRRTWHNDAWWYAIVDVIVVIVGSRQPEQYLKSLRKRDKDLTRVWNQIAAPLRIRGKSGAQLVNCANTEGVLRLIQSIRSPKAEPFKRWLAKVGFARVKRMGNKLREPIGELELVFATVDKNGAKSDGGLPQGVLV